MKLTDRLTASADVVAREVGGETVLLDLASGTYFGLDPVGARIWRAIEQDRCTLGEACDQVGADYEVERERLEADVLALAEQLVGHKLAAREA